MANDILITTGTGDFKQILYACRDGDLDTVKYFASRGADLNFIHAEFLFAPLHESIRHQHIDITQYLLEHGANPNLKEGYSTVTPWQLAQENQDFETLKLLKEHGAHEEHSRWGKRIAKYFQDMVRV